MKSYKELIVEEITNTPQVEGNGKLLVLMDSRAGFSEMLVLQKGILPLLTHYGLPFAIHDLANFPLEIPEVLNSRGIIIGHERMVKMFSKETIRVLKRGLTQGIGLVNLDGDLSHASSELKTLLGISPQEAPLLTDSLQFSQKEHFVTRFKEPGEKLSWERPLTLYWVEEMEEDWQVVASGIMGKEQLIIARHLIPEIAVVPGQYPAIALKNKEKGKIVQWFLSPRIFLPDFLGHCKGMDDILAGSIIWTAKKPFIYNSFPPFVVFRVDDVSGAGKFRWLRTAAEVGFKSAPSIFIDHMRKDSLEVARELQQKEKTEFSCHALSYYQLMGFRFGYGPYTEKEVAARYDRVQAFFAQNKLRISKTWNPHWGEIGLNELSEMKKLGVKYILGHFLPDDAKHGRLDWNPKPYGSVECFYDYCPDDPEIIRFASMKRGFEQDFLEGLTVFAGHSDKNQLDAIIKRGTEQITWGLSCGFYGQLLTHEQKIAVISDEDWE
ncbi:MAG: hypothetical protein KAV99_08165, partial [Candidatus Latescibacteria bacterium]|nr:hypothetical protein [Candidatus Latescibacterota bacterium]